jgi:hypothetical protein
MVKIPRPNLEHLSRQLDDLESKITGRKPGLPMIEVSGGLPPEDQVPHCVVRYGRWLWHRTADDGEDWQSFLRRVEIEAQLRGGAVIVVGGMPQEPRDDDVGEWSRVE